jgi:hypothetical protein
MPGWGIMRVDVGSIRWKMQLVVRVRPELFETGQTPQGVSPSVKLADVSSKFGVDIQPIHAGIAIPELASYFGAEVPDAETAKKLIVKLKETGIVDSAYLKPVDELP